MKDLRNFLVLVLIGLILPAVLLSFSYTKAFDEFEFGLLDWRFKYLNNDKAPSQDVVLLLIDEQSLTHIGRWPWRRDTYSAVLNYFSSRAEEGENKGPKAVFFDILFSEPSALDQVLDDIGDQFGALVESVQESGVSDELMMSFENYGELLSQGQAERNYDNILVESTAEFGRVYSNMMFVRQFDEQGNHYELRPLPLDTRLRGVKLHDQSVADYYWRPFNSYVLPLPALRASSLGLSVANFDPDIDGIYRRNPLVFRYGEQYFLSFALNAYLDSLGLTGDDVTVRPDGHLQIADVRVPQYDGRFRPYFYSQNFPEVSFAWLNQQAEMLLAGDLGDDPESFEKEMAFFDNKIVFIATSAAATFDMKATPMHPVEPGVLLHATIYSNLMQKDFLTFPPFWVTAVVTLMLTLLISAITIYSTHMMMQLIVPGIMLFMFVGVSAALFRFNNTALEMFTPMLSVVIAIISSYAFFSFTSGRDKRFLKQAFGNYISPELVDMMTDSGEPPQLGGEVGIRTAYFTDIQGFSTFSEQLTATRLVELLNEYLTVMTDTLLAEQGTLDKYEGDAIIAFFGAPVSLEDHAIRACRVAVRMQQNLLELRKKWSSEGDKWPLIVHKMRMRIGINSGEIVTGNMGSHGRMNYTMMGDSVNLAARLEEAAKQYGIFTQVSQFTVDLIGDEFELRELDTIRVVGKSEPVTTYEILGEKDQIPFVVKEMRDLFHQGLGHYKQSQWEQAMTYFQQSLALEYQRNPDLKDKTNPSLIYIKRCEQYKITPPPEGWCGVYTLTSK
jgi:adenylate cyclase